MIDDAGQTATIAGQSVSCTMSDETRSLDVTAEGGDMEDVERDIMVKASALNAVPAKFATVVAGGLTYFVQQVQRNTDADLYVITVSRSVELPNAS